MKHKQTVKVAETRSKSVRTLIAIPCMDNNPTPFTQSLLNLRKTGDTAYAMNANSLIYDSRNTFVANAIEKGYDRILWMDSDMVFEPDLLERLSADMDMGIEFVSALAFKRHFPTAPVIYKQLEYGRKEDGSIRASAVPFLDYPRNNLFEVAASGFGVVMVSTDLLRRVWDKHGPPFDPMTQIGEDLACCWRIAQLGVKMYCDSRIKVGHIGQFIFDEGVYLAQDKQSEWISTDIIRKESEQA